MGGNDWVETLEKLKSASHLQTWKIKTFCNFFLSSFLPKSNYCHMMHFYYQDKDATYNTSSKLKTIMDAETQDPHAN